ncbi:hypothetical protein NQ318_003454 [Aromia moschata]|uniref:Uncharacterized protein n=1 Tax=Aromia moschata TaxID=1265417 RepID=A0AAV8YWW9_9CUCU|nr:hypothetical protein NQ318_003454 [Aromia moschata]
MGAVMTSLTLGSVGRTGVATNSSQHGKGQQYMKEYPLVMDTKLKIIEILQWGDLNLCQKNIDLELIGSQAEGIFGSSEESAVLDLDGHGGRHFYVYFCT